VQYFEDNACLLEGDMRAMTRKIAAGTVPRFTIGFVASTIYDLLPDLVRRFRAAAPGTEVQLVETTTLDQIAALRDGRIDAGFGRLRFGDEAVTRRVIREEPLAVAVPGDHPLFGDGSGVRLGDIASLPLIIYPKRPRPSYADQVLEIFRDAEVRVTGVVEAGELQTALGLVASGAGICLVPASVKRLGRADIRYIDRAEPGITSPTLMSWRTGDTSPLLELFRTLVEDPAARPGAYT
jgi:DNA-binding transcriptional LysR family regulator